VRIFMPVLAVLVLASPVAAQDYRQVWVTQSGSGEVVHGRILDLSEDTVALMTGDHARVELPIDRVLRIEVRGDSVKNGAAIGAAVMGGLGLLTCAEYHNGGACAVGVTLNTILGGFIGAGIDAMNPGRTTIYSKPAAPAATGPAARVQFKLRF
jgi:hypothetical protein